MRSRKDDLGPALLALGALVLGLAATVAIWTMRVTPAERAREEARRETTEGTLERTSRTFTYRDAGVGIVPVPGEWRGFELANGLEPSGDEMDPQVLAMRRLLARVDDAGLSGFVPYRSTGHAIVASGIPGVTRNASCDLRVLPVGSETGFNCVVRVRCDGVVVYPDGALEAGYAPCEVEGGVSRLATDHAPTDRDGDPELLVDLGEHVARVRDVRYGGESFVEIRLD